jgi:Alpha/beta-hydrolase family/Alpha/beta-hydrolase family N-terminus
MSQRIPLPPASADVAISTGLLVTSGIVSGTFARSLSTRSAVDQGVVTGLASGLHYLLTVGTQDALQAAATALVRVVPTRVGGDAALMQRRLTFAADLAAIPLGLAVPRMLPPRPGEPVALGAVRQLAWRFALTGLGGTLAMTTRAGARAVDHRLGAGGRIAAFPFAVPVGLGVAYVIDRRRAAALGRLERPAPEAVAEPGTEEPEQTPPSWLRSVGVAAGVVGGLAGAGYGEHLIAGVAGRGLSAALPGEQQLWRLAGHAGCIVLLGGAALAVWGRAMRRIEAGTSELVPILDADEADRWTGPTVSGGPQSKVPWATLGREGRRHALALVRPQTVPDRPKGVPDLSIETVMGEPARATPIQVYVGLDSAPDARERVDLALAEMERTGAFDRSLIMLVSPTGTGYVNYVAVAATQYLSRGDVATVTLQYSKRPSPLSLGKVKAAREQNRLLWLRILERLRDRPEPRPRIVLFGESLGAHTSQDVFLHWGTLGLRALGIDRALWIGTPYGSGWMHEVTTGHRLDVDADSVAVVNDYEQLEQLGAERRSRLRYVLVSHDNDGVTKFGPDLLVTAPRWLGPDRPRPETVAGASPRGIPADMRWRPITTFFQSLVDMKNAQLGGAYRSWGHDYRPDLARFVSEVFELPASPRQLANVEEALRRRETVRADLFAPRQPVPTG